MPLRRLALSTLLALAAPLSLPALAQDAPAAQADVPALSQALRLDDLFAVLKDEGVAYGKDLEAQMFPGGGGPRWEAEVAAIYDTTRLRDGFDSVLQRELAQDPAVLAEITGFFTSDLGRRVVGLEIDARRAFLDQAQEEAARVAAETRASDRDPKVKLLDRFIAAGDLIEMNVAGGLSGNLAFLTGMAETSADGTMLPQDELMSQVWGQEEQIRADTTSWLHAYLGLAYAPLTEAELAAYADFMETPAGQRLNAALFAAFDEVFRDVSYQLGRAAGRASQGRDI
ncbi:DUF2059 domain-containing protein [Tabrizicola aquatica]|uniref:DUF2059 domain-containing protein n=1 Tax=Tabrizicola aquatica TaxID=909926 RepID=UPI000CD0B2C7|nr:DUF2059 domain-containing protein [Tabrizicola aquatica]